MNEKEIKREDGRDLGWTLDLCHTGEISFTDIISC